MIEMGVGLDAGEWAEVQRHGCGRRKDARRKVVLEVGRGRATPSPLLRQHVLPIGYLGTPSGPRAAAALVNTARSPTVRPNGWNLSVRNKIRWLHPWRDTSPGAYYEPVSRPAGNSFISPHILTAFPPFSKISHAYCETRSRQSWSKP